MCLAEISPPLPKPLSRPRACLPAAPAAAWRHRHHRLPWPPAEMRVSYTCDNGERVQLRDFPQQGIAVLERGGQNSELQQSVTPPGFTCSGGQTTLRVAQDRLTMQMSIGMMATASCGAT